MARHAPGRGADPGAGAAFADPAPDGSPVTVFHARRWRWLLPVLAPVFLAGSIALFGGVLILAWLAVGVLAWVWIGGWREIRIDGRGVAVEIKGATPAPAGGGRRRCRIAVEGCRG